MNPRVRELITTARVIPSIRVSSSADALFAAEAIASAGIPIVEVTMTVPGALDVIASLVGRGDVLVGAGSVRTAEVAERCIGAGVEFLTTTGLDLDIVKVAQREDVTLLPGVLTPSEVMAATKAGCDFVKVFPCAQVGGANYIKVLKGPFPDVPMIAAGGVTQNTVADFLHAGAIAVGVGAALIPPKAIQLREGDWIRELARRFVVSVKEAHEFESAHHD